MNPSLLRLVVKSCVDEKQAKLEMPFGKNEPFIQVLSKILDATFGEMGTQYPHYEFTISSPIQLEFEIENTDLTPNESIALKCWEEMDEALWMPLFDSLEALTLCHGDPALIMDVVRSAIEECDYSTVEHAQLAH